MNLLITRSDSNLNKYGSGLRQMVECSDCSEWFHRMCERIPDAVFRKKNSKCDWLCYQCSSKRAKTTCT